MTARLLLCLLLAAPAAAQETAQEPPTAATPAEAEPAPPPPATIEGTVRYAGSTPLRLKTFTNSVDTAACGERVASHAVRSGSRGALADVLVEVRTADGALVGTRRLAPAAQPVEVTLGGCHFEPHLVVLPPGSRVELLNPDGVLHDVRALSLRNEPVKARLQRFRRRLFLGPEHFRKSERLRVACERHSWSGGWWVVTENPLHAVTGDDGRFAIGELEAGTYLVTAWHGEFQPVEKEAILSPGETLRLDFELK